MVKPVTPQEAGAAKVHRIPPEVVETFNDLIVRSYLNGTCTILQETIVNEICKRMPGIKKGDIYSNKWLEVESLYSEYGWKVTYNKTTSDPTKNCFCFTKKD